MSGPTVKKWDLNTCGLTTICGWSSGNGFDHDKTNWVKWLEDTCDAKWSSKPNGNFLYVITSQQLKEPSAPLKAALDHPGTRIIHAYKQNAHGPNWIFIVMTHIYPNTNDLKNWTNNVAEYRERSVFDPKSGWYKLNDLNFPKV